MEEENQQQVKQEMKEPQRVTMKDPKKVEAGKRLAAINHKKREAKKREEQVQFEKTTSRVNQYYGIGAVLAVGVTGGLGYYIYRTQKGQASREVKDVSMPHRDLRSPAPRNPPKQPPQSIKFDMD